MKKKRKVYQKSSLSAEKIKKLWDNKVSSKRPAVIEGIPFKNTLIGAFFANIVVLGFVFLIQSSLPPQVPLFYGLPEGESQLAPSLALVIPSLVSLAIIALNLVISYFLKNEFFKKVLITTAIGTTFFSIVTTIKIVLLISSL